MQTELSFAYCYIAISVLDFVLANHKWGSDSAKSPLSTEVQPLYDMSGENQAKKGENIQVSHEFYWTSIPNLAELLHKCLYKIKKREQELQYSEWILWLTSQGS